ncbi:MAG: glycoside hydrolase family 130 protein [Bacilli bacterium]|jgi:predicted GH43/DUF377 family glycosyl hydrolase
MNKQLLVARQDIAPSRPDFRVLGIFNPGIVKLGEETIMLARVAETMRDTSRERVTIPVYRSHQYMFLDVPINDPNYDLSDARVIRNHDQNYLTSISHFRVGRSRDGIHFHFDEKPVLPDTIYEEYGIEDPRITEIDGRYYITYTAVSAFGINAALMVTDDFKTFTRLGNIFPFDNKDTVIFPKKIGGYYYAYHRPSTSDFGKLDIWVAKSTNLLHWGEHVALTSARVGYGSSTRVGASCVPFLTDQGWVVIYHSADKYHRYHLAALLVDKDDPSRVLKRSKEPLVQPSEPYEIDGFVRNVIFSCGLVAEKDGLDIYYGACDQQVAKCHLTYQELFDNLEEVA